MKSTDINRYKILLKSLTEAESVVSDVSKIDTDILVSQIKDMERGSNQAKVEFLQNLKKRYHITGPGSMTNSMKMLCMGITGLSIAGGILKTIGRAYYSAVYFSGGDVTSGIFSLVGICTAAFMTFIFYKIFKIVDSTDVIESIQLPVNRKKYKELLLKKTLLESEKLFNKIDYITESYMINESDSKNTNGIISKAYVLCKEMFKKITSGVSNFAKKYPAFAAAILICAGLIIGYMVGKPGAAPAPVDVTSKSDQAGLGSKDGSVNFSHKDLQNANGGLGVTMIGGSE